MKKYYSKPQTHVIEIETECLMEASAPGLIGTPANGTDAGSKAHDGNLTFDLWGTDEEE